jgi:uncharacterized protein YndB with AHSA1/START domain
VSERRNVEQEQSQRGAEAGDRIEKRVFLKAPRSRVWRALTDSRQFGAWFGLHLTEPFVPGHTVKGHITHPGYEHLTAELAIERIEPERLFSYRWHPYAIDPQIDYSKEARTLVEFQLEEAPGGSELRIIESGFDRIPLARRAEAWRMNENGWAIQATNIERHVTSA